MDNLAGKPEFEAVKKEMCKRMESGLSEQGDPRMQGKGDVFDNYPYVNHPEVAMVDDMWKMVKEKNGEYWHRSRSYDEKLFKPAIRPPDME